MQLELHMKHEKRVHVKLLGEGLGGGGQLSCRPMRISFVVL